MNHTFFIMETTEPLVNGDPESRPPQPPSDENKIPSGNVPVVEGKEAATASIPPVHSQTRPLGMLAVEAMEQQQQQPDDDAAAAEAPLLAPPKRGIDGGMQSLTPPSRRSMSDAAASSIATDLPNHLEMPELPNRPVSPKPDEGLRQPSFVTASPPAPPRRPSSPLPQPEEDHVGPFPHSPGSPQGIPAPPKDETLSETTQRSSPKTPPQAEESSSRKVEEASSVPLQPTELSPAPTEDSREPKVSLASSKEEDTAAEVGETSVLATSVSASPASSFEEEDAISKSRARRAQSRARRAPNDGPAIRPGAVAVVPLTNPTTTPSATNNNNNDQETSAALLTIAEQDAIGKSRARRAQSRARRAPNDGPAIRPGAVAVVPLTNPTTNPSAANNNNNDQETYAALLTLAEQDRLGKSGGGRPIVALADVRVGAVSIVASNPPEPAPVSTTSMKTEMTNNEQDDIMAAKSRARSDRPSVPNTVLAAVAVGVMEPPASMTTTTVEKDRLAKPRGTSDDSVRPGAVAVTPAAQMTAAEQQDRLAKLGGSRPIVPIGDVPVGAVFIARPNPPEAEPAATVSTATNNEQDDTMAKSRAAPPSTLVGAVAMGIAEEATPPATMTTAEQDRLAKSRGRVGPDSAPAEPITVAPIPIAADPSFMTQAEQDEYQKSRGRRMQSMDGTENMSVLGNEVDLMLSANKADSSNIILREPSTEPIKERERQRRYDDKSAMTDREGADHMEKHRPDLMPDHPAESINEYYMTYGEPKCDHGMSKQEGDGSNQFLDGIAIGGDVEYGQPSGHDNGLAVAIAIEDDQEDDKLYAHALEYDPESKPPIYKNRRFQLYGIGGFLCLVVVAIALGVAIPLLDQGEILLTDAPTLTPTMPPTTPRENDFLSRLAEQATEEVLVSGTSARLAADWIMFEDPLEIEPDDPRLLQRFMMTFLYYATSNNGKDPWLSCNPPQEDEDDTCTLLEWVYDSDPIPQEGRVRWLSGQDECLWEGVVCAGGDEVLGVEILGQNLTGTVPSELASLPFLQKISMPYNLLEGGIPSEFATLRYLIDIELHGNMLTGTIPEELYSSEAASDLVRLNLGENLLEGTLDTRIGLMTNLKGLHLHANNFEGSLPTEIGELKYLVYTRMHGNELDGPLPSELGNLVHLTEILYFGNHFTGTIPTELGNLIRMEYLEIYNTALQGPIPEELYNMTSVLTFALLDNSLTGTLSTRVGQLTSVTQLILSGNALTGTIPTEISQLTALNVAWFNWNQFSGAFPDSVCAAIAPIDYLQADCYDDGTGFVANSCACCNICCVRGGKCWDV